MIHWVGGYARSGTSMMMGALEAGGMPALYDDSKNKETIAEYSSEDYRINKKLYELSDYMIPDYREKWDGHLVKFLGPRLAQRTREGDRVILMLREHGEVLGSHKRAFGRQFGLNKQRFERRSMVMCRLMRKDGVDVLPIWYRAVIDNPYYWFQIIAGMGWPINPEDAAETVDPDLYRVRSVA